VQRRRGVFDFERIHRRARTGIQLRIRLSESFRYPQHVRASLGECDARFQLRDHVQLAKRVVRRGPPKPGERQPDLRLLLIHAFPHGGQVEALGQDAGDDVGAACDRQGPAERLRVPVEPVLEIFGGDNRDPVRILFSIAGE
jgi:hypothetical protein